MSRLNAKRHRDVLRATFDPLAPGMAELRECLLLLREEMARDGETLAPEGRAVMNMIWRGKLHFQAELAARDAAHQIETMIYPAGRSARGPMPLRSERASPRAATPR